MIAISAAYFIMMVFVEEILCSNLKNANDLLIKEQEESEKLLLAANEFVNDTDSINEIISEISIFILTRRDKNVNIKNEETRDMIQNLASVGINVLS